MDDLIYVLIIPVLLDLFAGMIKNNKVPYKGIILKVLSMVGDRAKGLMNR